MATDIQAEGSFGFLIRQIGALHRDLLAFEARTEQKFEHVDGRLDRMDARLGQMDGRIDRVETELRGLRHDMPRIVGDTMREVLREERKKWVLEAAELKGERVEGRGMKSSKFHPPSLRYGATSVPSSKWQPRTSTDVHGRTRTHTDAHGRAELQITHLAFQIEN